MRRLPATASRGWRSSLFRTISGPAALFLGLVCWVAKLLVLAGVLALLQTAMGRSRLVHVPHLLGVAILLGLLAMVFLFAGAGTV